MFKICVAFLLKKNLDCSTATQYSITGRKVSKTCVDFGVGCVLFRELPCVWELDAPDSAVIIHSLEPRKLVLNFLQHVADHSNVQTKRQPENVSDI